MLKKGLCLKYGGHEHLDSIVGVTLVPCTKLGTWRKSLVTLPILYNLLDIKTFLFGP